MSNPTVTIGNSISGPSDPQLVRKAYHVIRFDGLRWTTYADGQEDDFDPTGEGVEFIMWDLLGNHIENRPGIVSADTWESLSLARSGFLTARSSVMPKIIVPSRGLVDNGLANSDWTYFKSFFSGDEGDFEVFNWDLVAINGLPPTEEDLRECVSVGGFESQSLSVKAMDDGSGETTLNLELSEGGASGGLFGAIPDELVGHGAFQIMLNVVPHTSGTASISDESDSLWNVEIQFGDVTLELSDNGSCRVIVAGEEDGNVGVANLSEAQAKECAPQKNNIKEGTPFTILVYPVWNGVVVSSGIQDSAENVATSSCFVPKIKSASIRNKPYSDDFDPKNPSEVEVGIDGGAVLVDMGSSITMFCRNCSIDVAYVPCFFAPSARFDHFMVIAEGDSSDAISYKYNVYPYWTANGTDAVLEQLKMEESEYPGPAPDSVYGYVPYEIVGPGELTRYALEVFAAVLEVEETREFPLRNANGSFNLQTGGSGAGPGGSWTQYIQSVSVTLSVNGSSGSVTVDKLGAAGQSYEAPQSVGAFTINASGGFETVSGNIFMGLAMGVSENKSSSGAEWSIPLVGLEKKLDDMALINVPYFDGETFSTVVSFLCRYAGINHNLSGANGSIRLSISDDVNVPRFDWKTGTSVRSALEDVMQDTMHTFLVMDGAIYFYQVGADGLPTSLGTNWKSQYPDTKMITYDASPDFDDLRNEIVVVAMQQIPDGEGVKVSDLPLFPRVEMRSSNTNPNIPWAKSMFRSLPGALSPDEIANAADRLQGLSSKYILLGRTTIPGNANIRPFDRWGEYVIYSVSHTVDLQSKRWTTDLEFMSGG